MIFIFLLETLISIKILIERKFRKWMNKICWFCSKFVDFVQNLLILFKIVENFDVFSTRFSNPFKKKILFAKFVFNFCSLKIKIFPVSIKKIVFLPKKIRFCENGKKFVQIFVKILNKSCKSLNNNIIIYLLAEKFSRKRLN